MTPSATSASTQRHSTDSGGDARERILRTSYRLFSQHGVKAVGIDRIVAEAGVAKATLYWHFRSKDELVIAALERREDLWTRGWLEQEIKRRARTPKARLLAIFDAFDDWFRREDYESCLFINTLLEAHDRTNPIGSSSVAHLAKIRDLARDLAAQAGIPNADDFARQWQLLMAGAIVAAAAGDVDSARRARDLAELLLRREAPARS